MVIRKLHRFAISVGVILALTSDNLLTSACSVFVWRRDGQVLFCNNEDFNQLGYLWVVPATDGTLGRVNLGFRGGHAQGSMNTAGLAFDAMSVPAVGWRADPELPTPKNLVEEIMDGCETVEQAVERFRGANCTHLANSQFLFADATGDAALIAWQPGQGLSVIRSDGEFLIGTNVRQQGRAYRCARYVRLEQLLGNVARPASVDDAAKYLDAVHQQGPGGFTSYSNVFDLKQRTITLYHLTDFTSSCEFRLEEMLKNSKGERTAIASFFSEGKTREEVTAGPQRQRFDTEVPLPPEDLQALAGFYSPEGHPEIEFEVRDQGGLQIVGPDGAVTTLFPESRSVFRMEPDRGQVAFLRDANDKVTGLELRRATDQRARRVR